MLVLNSQAGFPVRRSTAACAPGIAAGRIKRIRRWRNGGHEGKSDHGALRRAGVEWLDARVDF
jgi:hypothetical protein